jgi:hypothetical protein
MSRHARSARRLALVPTAAPRPQAPADTLLDQIAAGELDPHLTQVAEAIRARFDLLQTVSSAKALARLNVGDRVRINHHASPRYLHGIHDTIVHLDEQTATVCVHRAVGRFKNGEIRCPPLVLDRLPPATQQPPRRLSARRHHLNSYPIRSNRSE